MGKLNGGGTRGYGYDDDRVTVREDEAEVIREAARRILAGESLGSLCRDLAARDVRTTTGRHWTPQMMRRLLGSARVSGRREHAPHDTYAGTRPLLAEITAAAVWPAIISADDSDRLRMLLSRPSRRSNPGTGRTYLLSGILRCSKCGHGLAGRPRAGTPRYVCPAVPGGTACGRTTAVAARTDDLIRDLVLVALEGPELRAHLARQRQADPALIAAVARDRAKLVELSESWARDELPMAEWRAARETVEQRLHDNEARLERLAGPDPLGTFIGTVEQLIERWEAMNLSQRRAIVGAVVEKVVVHPGDPHRWDPHRFEPIWR